MREERVEEENEREMREENEREKREEEKVGEETERERERERERSSVGVKKRKITGESQQMCERKGRVRERISQKEKDRERERLTWEVGIRVVLGVVPVVQVLGMTVRVGGVVDTWVRH